MKMSRNQIILIAGMVIAAIIAIVLILTMKEPDKDHIDTDIAPDGVKYGLSEEGILYQPEYYDEYYGHAADRVGEYFEDIKPDYYKDIEFSSVHFPFIIKYAYYFPTFVMFDAIEYAKIPEEEMRKRLSPELVDFYLELEEHGPGGDQGGSWERTPPPRYEDIYVRRDGENSYKITYVTSTGSYAKYITIINGVAYDTRHLSD